MTSDMTTDKDRIPSGAIRISDGQNVNWEAPPAAPGAWFKAFDFQRLAVAIERCATALETLASDVKPPASQALVQVGIPPEGKTLLQSIAEQAPEHKRQAEAVKILEAPAATPVKTDPQVGVPGTLAAEPGPSAASQFAEPAKVETSALPSTASPVEDVTKKIENLDWNDEAASLEKTFADNEAAKRILGDALYAEVWVTPLQEQASIATATALRDVTIKTLGSRAAFERARDATGIRAGTIPNGEQARRLVLKHVVKAVVK